MLTGILNTKHEELKTQLGESKFELANETMTYLIRVISNRDHEKNPVLLFISLGIFDTAQKLINCNNFNDKLIAKGCWLLCNIFHAKSQHFENLIIPETLKRLLKLTCSEDIDLTMNAIWAIGNLSGEGNFRETFVNFGIHNFILNIANRFEVKNSKEKLAAIAWVVNVFLRKPLMVSNETIEAYLPLISELLDQENEEIKKHILMAIYNISLAIQNDTLFTMNIPKRLMRYINHPDGSISFCAIRIFNNISSSENDNFTQELISTGFLEHLNESILSNKVFIRKETCFFLANALCCNEVIQKAILTHEIMDKMESLFVKDELSVKICHN